MTFLSRIYNMSEHFGAGVTFLQVAPSSLYMPSLECFSTGLFTLERSRTEIMIIDSIIVVTKCNNGPLWSLQ
jgi:hypothetical protein